MNAAGVRKILTKRIAEAGSATAFAESIGMTKQYICAVEKGIWPPAKNILNALGLEKVVSYRAKGGK